MPRKAVDSEVRLQSLNMKTTPDLRRKLEEAAAKSGRALTHEVEARLKQSFMDEERSGGSHTEAMLRFIATGIHLIENMHGGAKWTDDVATAVACRAMIDATLEGFLKASAPAKQGLLGMLNAAEFEEDRQSGETLALQLRRERLRRQRERRGQDTAKLDEEIKALSSQLAKITDPSTQPMADLSNIGLLGAGNGAGLLNALGVAATSDEANKQKAPYGPKRLKKADTNRGTRKPSLA